jgi:hypothetical protein
MLQLMILLLLPVLVGVVAGYATGGRLVNIETVRHCRIEPEGVTKTRQGGGSTP